ncbi:sulfite exporter TauE/SafE family protein [Spiribacter vilamensis]|uniref:sulfite exporter TauE/SafE family protein n=1 Tax=Spiribacter vilamensis TaxID=531306 RepID=UPI001EEF92CA|nr:sulfite exporter TauE/SafE family protein [Spiribacter vilamensis]
MLLSLLIYVAAGAVVGFVSGLFGIGGGVIVVPMLLPIFQAQGLGMDVAMHMAVGSSLATIVVTGLSSARAHWRLGNLVVSALPWLVAGLVTGALVGAQLAAALSGDILRIIFALFVLALAVRMIFALEPPPGRVIPPPGVVSGVGFVIGALSSLVGIGGGTLLVPFLIWSGVTMRQAVGTSAAAGVSIALAGSIGFIVAGTGEDQLPALSTGYIYWPAVGGITVASVFLAPLGARVASRVPAVWLRRAFAAFLVIVGFRLLLSG